MKSVLDGVLYLLMLLILGYKGVGKNLIPSLRVRLFLKDALSNDLIIWEKKNKIIRNPNTYKIIFFYEKRTPDSNIVSAYSLSLSSQKVHRYIGIETGLG